MLFNDWCKETYNKLIETRKTRNIGQQGVYLERHHIIPKSIGGSNKKDNIIYLTPREHLIAHMLLAKVYPNNIKLQLAVLAMLKQTKSRKLDEKYINLVKNSRVIEELRINARKELSESKKGENNPMYGKIHTEESKRLMSLNSSHANRGKHLTEEQKRHLHDMFSGKNSPTYGIKWSEEHNRRVSESRKGKFTGKDNPFFGRSHTEETKRKIAEVRKLHAKKVIDNSDGEILTIQEMAKKKRVSYSTIVYWILHHPEYGISYVV